MQKLSKFKRLYIDCETSPNVVFSWNVGYDLQIRISRSLMMFS